MCVHDEAKIIMLVGQRGNFFSYLRGGVDFTNMFFTRNFYMQRSPKRKKTDKSSVYFCAFGSECIKAACKALTKLTLGVNFTKPMAQSANVLKQGIDAILFHQQKSAQLYQCTPIEVIPNV